MKKTYGHYVDKKEPASFSSVWYEFKTFKVYWTYRWWIAKQIDDYMAITPIKTQFGDQIIPTNYASKYT
jgi:hypothetical protein